MATAAQRDNWRENSLCLVCGKARDVDSTSCNSCLVNTTLGRVRNRAKKAGRTCTLTKAWVQASTPSHCPCCSVRMERGGDKTSSPSIDRVDNSRGYEADNCWIICFSCNKLKGEALSLSELQEQIHNMQRLVTAWEAREHNAAEQKEVRV